MGVKKKQIRLRWFISFFLILLISMVPAMLIYRFSLAAIENQALETNRAQQKLLESTLESVMDDVDRVADNLTINSEFAFLRNIPRQMTTEQRWRLYKFGISSFKYMLSNDTFVQQGYVYLKNSDILLGNNYCRLSTAYNSEMLGFSLSLEEWKTLFAQHHTNTYIPATYNSQEGFFYLQSMRSPTGRSDEYDVVLIVFIASQPVADVMSSGEDQQNSLICVLDENDQLLLSNVPKEKALHAVSAAQHEANMMLDGWRYLCQTSYSEESGLKYICYSSYDTAYRQVRVVRGLSLLFLIAGLVAGLMVALAMTRRHYMPVERIISRIENAPRQQNEFDTILSYIEEKQFAQENLENELKEKQAILRQEQLARFLTGNMQWNPDTLRLLSGCHLALDRPAYAVAVVCMSEFAAETGRNMACNVAELMRETLVHTLPGITLDEALMDMNLLLVLGMEESEGESLHARMQEMEGHLRSAYHMEMAIGLSNVSDGVEHLPELYRQAAAALEFAQMHRESRIVCYPPAMGNVAYSYPLEKEMLLVRAVSNGEKDQAMQILDEVFEMALLRPNIIMQECLRVDLIATCLRIFAYADKIVARETWEGYGAARRLMLISNMAELFDEIRAIFSRLCDVIAGQRILSKETQSVRIRDMVEEQWQSSELSVASIAEKLNLHPSYVSRIFKEEQGMGLLEYINRYRVEQASLLLQHSDASVSQIAAQCGYTSDASFIRVFRQYRGITPGKYREETQNG